MLSYHSCWKQSILHCFFSIVMKCSTANEWFVTSFYVWYKTKIITKIPQKDIRAQKVQKESYGLFRMTYCKLHEEGYMDWIIDKYKREKDMGIQLFKNLWLLAILVQLEVSILVSNIWIPRSTIIFLHIEMSKNVQQDYDIV